MANKAVLSVNVDDSQFDSFLAKFRDYEKQLDDQPSKWKAISEAMEKAGLNGGGHGAGADLTKMTDALKDSLGLAAANAALLAEALGKASKAQQHLGKHVEKTEGRMRGLARLSDRMKHGAWWAGKNALRVGGILGGVAGGLGVYEFLSLPARVTRLGMEAQGLGISPGAYQAYNIGMTGLLQNPAGVQSSLFGLQHNIGALAPLAAMAGIDPYAAAKESSEAFHRQMFIHLPDVLKRFPKMIQGQMYQELGMAASGYSIQDLLLPKTYNMTDAQRARYYDKNVAPLAHELNWKKKTINDWEKLNRTLLTAEGRVKAALIDGLAPLTPELRKLSTTFSTYLSTHLSNDLKRFGADIESIASGLSPVVGIFKWLGAHPVAEKALLWGAFGKYLGGYPGALAAMGLSAEYSTRKKWAGPAARFIGDFVNGFYGGAPQGWVNKSFLPAIAVMESGGQANPYTARNTTPGSTSYGKYGLIKSTWRYYAAKAGLGANAPETAINQEKVAMFMRKRYGREFHNNLLAMAIAWHQGPGEASAWMKHKKLPEPLDLPYYKKFERVLAAENLSNEYSGKIPFSVAKEHPREMGYLQIIARDRELQREILFYLRAIARNTARQAGAGDAGSAPGSSYSRSMLGATGVPSYP